MALCLRSKAQVYTRAAAVVAPVRATWACVASHSTPKPRFLTSTSRVTPDSVTRELSVGSGAIFTPGICGWKN